MCSKLGSSSSSSACNEVQTYTIKSIRSERYRWCWLGKLAEEEGFEPPEPLRAQRFSRPPHSTALPLLRSDRCLWERAAFRKPPGAGRKHESGVNSACRTFCSAEPAGDACMVNRVLKRPEGHRIKPEGRSEE